MDVSNKYVQLNTQLTSEQATVIPAMNGRQGDNNRQVFFQVKDGDMNHNLSGQTVQLAVMDSKEVPKVLSGAYTVDNAALGRFSLMIPWNFYQSVGDSVQGYIRFLEGDTVVSSIPIQYTVYQNRITFTQTESTAFISDVDDMVAKATARFEPIEQKLSAAQTASKILTDSVDSLNESINKNWVALKNVDNTFTGGNTFEKKIVAPNGLQGKSDSAGQADEATHATKADNADSAKHAEVADKLVPENDQTVNNLTVKGQLKVSGNQKVVSFSGTIPKFGFAIEGKRIGDTVRINLARHDTPDIRSWTGFDYFLPNGFKPAFDVSNVMWCDLQIAKLQINQDGSFFLMNRGIQHTTPGDSGFTLEFKTNDDFPE